MTTSRPDASFLFAHPAHLVAFGFGSGLAPRAPGTVGTLLGWPLYWLIVAVASSTGAQCALIAAAFVVGIWACARTGRALGVADHGGIVWDEIVAFCVVLMTVPERWGWWLAAFAAFRFFDIVKPAPIGWLDKHFKNGFGVMVDDLMAAAYAAGLLAFARNLI